MLKDARGAATGLHEAITAGVFGRRSGPGGSSDGFRENNRAVLAMSRRVGFEIDGQLPSRVPVALLRLEA